MSIPREGSRDIDKGILISSYPDWCKVPDKPCPFPLHAKQYEDANTTPTVRQTSKRSHTTKSIMTCSHGDEAGIGLGVESGTRGSICQPKTWSKTVRFEGANAVRHNDEWWMNNKNTSGKMNYVKDVRTYDPTSPFLHKSTNLQNTYNPIDKEPSSPIGAWSDSPQILNDANTELHFKLGQQYAFANIGSAAHGQMQAIENMQLQGGKNRYGFDDKNRPNNGGTGNIVRVSSDPCDEKLELCFAPGDAAKNSVDPQNRKAYELEYRRQLEIQHRGINKMSPAEIVDNMNAYEKNPTGIRAQAEVYQKKAREDYEKSLSSRFNAKNDKDRLIDEVLARDVALHAPDMIAGGKMDSVADQTINILDRFGWGTINSSIGSHWKSRKTRYKEYMERLKAANCKRPKVTLAYCPSEPDMPGQRLAGNKGYWSAFN
ncbi:polymorphic toxin type 15 domain-containing protein [Bartonella sp. HY406]|uniref:polymorphic toxin type 15 domain-containing protein n=1 Tax=Bartonella sp. HY406 TaxID=2979331 RepID=UPI0021C7E645|nr:polymorphic toxin type 15 domain-containing protein [Bartonella sp. HY406]UXN02619.1 polymorphic toxin type 15 domain-containing protein [Bartonella sp. HY406]